MTEMITAFRRRLGDYAEKSAHLGLVLGALLTLPALAGCGSLSLTDAPPPRPTESDLARIRTSTEFPVLWLGRAHAGLMLTRAESSHGRHPAVSFSYGEPSCDPGSGCTYPIDVASSPRRDPPTDIPTCWRPVGRAWLLSFDCAKNGEGELYTGPVSVYLYSEERPLRELARALTRMDVGGRGGALAAPKRFSCREAASLPVQFRSRMPKQMRPRCR